ncbi:MAG: response regulator, partial [Gammaproteobacteria bacterium]|nr:response regulator [Gammaproteobacteria bacterium]NIO61040.1 response regulator [Gammaproteobacteria bacterium]NIT39988.1 response regulator [Gammaproteobacteria bacterium]
MTRIKTILLADDDPDFIESMNAFLNEHGYNVIIAQQGEEAIQKILQYEIDVLVLDLKLPIVDGVGVYIDINMHGKHIPT